MAKRGPDIELAKLELKTALEKIKALKDDIRQSKRLPVTPLEIFERLQSIEIFIQDGLIELE